ncbi:MAG: RNA polymerase subunit sigma-24 [Actinobacteria bacterium]|nr:MAG: RNA polymerase subunit sigma-24 [Actinomycetota bacterium]
MAPSPTQRVVDAVWRIESARLIAGLTRIVRDLGLAEELAQDALVAALEQWPESGVPDNPGAWLMAVGKRRAIDLIRRQDRYDRKLVELARDLSTEEPEPEPAAAIEDDLLLLVFIACHPVLSATSRCAQAQVPFEVPEGAELAARLGSVLEVIYLIFNEGYAATAGDDWMRPTLCEEALRLGRIVAELMPKEPEVHGLVALLEIQASRSAARVGPSGEPVLLYEQDRGRWNQLLIRRGLAALDRAEALGGAPGPYLLQAAIAACHARARTPEETDWVRIAALYQALALRTPSPVVELNRAVAVGMAYGPAQALPIVDALTAEPALANYHLLPAVRGDLLVKLGRRAEARTEFERAATLTRNARERTLLLDRAAGTTRPG